MILPKTVDEAYGAVNPEQPLTGGNNDPRYVNCAAARGSENEARLIARRIQRSEPPHYSKQLFTGHRGCGKTTELFRLKRILEDEYHFLVVYFDVETELDVSDLDYPDVLLAIAQQVEKQLRETAHIELHPKLLENVARWFGTTIITEQQSHNVEETLKTQYGLGVKTPARFFADILVAFKGEIKNSSQRRTEIRRELERNATQLLQRVNELVDNAQVCLKQILRRGLVLIIDGLEKLLYRVMSDGGPSSHDMLFIDHGEQLRAPHCHVILTVPINLLFNKNVGQIFPDYTILPMVKITEEHGRPCEIGRQALRDVVARRVDVGAIFDNLALVDELVMASGGHVRDLLRLVRYTFDYTSDTVSAEHVQQAKRKLVNEYDYLMQPDDLPRLHEVHSTRQVPSDEPHALLLHNLLVLEYRNGGRWADVHPAVQATRKFQEAKPKPRRPTRARGRK